MLRDNVVMRFLRETRGELRKVVWPSRREATNLSIMVIVISLSLGLFLWILDLLFERGIAFLVGS